MKTKKILIIFLFLVILTVLSTFIYGFGVTTPYWDTNPLVMSPGQTVEFALLLQNMVGSDDIKATATVVIGAEFVEIIDKNNEYLVPLNTRDSKINLRVTIPENATNGDYVLGIRVDALVTNLNSGAVQIGTGVEQKIPLQIRNGMPQPVPLDLTPPESLEKKGRIKINNTTIFVIAAILIVFILLWVYRNYKKKKTY